MVTRKRAFEILKGFEERYIPSVAFTKAAVAIFPGIPVKEAMSKLSYMFPGRGRRKKKAKAVHKDVQQELF